MFDILFAFIGILIFFFPLLLFGIIIKISSKGPVIHWSYRVGVNNSFFRMAKLRTMKNGTPILASNMLNKPEKYFICFGKFLRKYAIDELPQLINILLGHMSFVGPRPVILDDHGIISLRTKKRVNTIKPGLTGLAQINGRNELSIYKKVHYDEIYMQNMSMLLDFKIVLLTNFYMIRENILDNRINRQNNVKTKLKIIN